MKRPWVGFLTALTLVTLFLPGIAQSQGAKASPTAAPATPGPVTPTPVNAPKPGDKPVVPGPATVEATSSPSPSATPTDSASNSTAIWVSDTDNGRILRLEDMTGKHLASFGYPGHGAGRLLEPCQIWVDAKGRIYIADKGNDRIVRIDDVTGKGWTVLEGYKAPEGVAVRGEQVFVADTGNNRIMVYDQMNGNLTRTITDIRIQKPTGLWFDEDNELYACCGEDPPGGKVVRVVNVTDADNSKWRVFDGQGLKPTGFAPAQIVTQKDGIWIIDASSNRVVRIDNLEGRDAHEWGGYGSTVGRYVRPQGLAVDKNGNVYIADTGNDRVVRFNASDPTKLTVWNGEIKEPHDANTVNLRSPHSVFVWCPVTTPKPPEPKDKKKKEPKKDDKGKK